MSSATDVKGIYRSIIDEVVTKSRSEFVQEGVDEAILDELRVLWEEKLQQSGVLNPPPPRPAPLSSIQMPNPAQGFQYQQYYGRPSPAQPSQLGRPSYYAPHSAVPWQQNPAGGQIRPAQGSQYQRPILPASQAPNLYQMGGRPVSQQGIPYANLLAMPQYSHHSNPQYIRPSSAAPEMEHKPNPEALLAYIRQGAAASSAARPVVQNPSQQMVPPFQGQGQAQASLQGLTQQQLQTHQLLQQLGQQLGGQQQRQQQQQQRGAGLQSMGAYQPANSSASAASIAPHQLGAQQPSGQQTLYRPQAGQPTFTMADLAGQKRKADGDQANGRAKQHQQGPGGIVQLDGSQDKDDNEREEVKDEAAEEDEAEDKLSDVSSSNEAEEDIPNQCLSQFSKEQVTRTKNKWKATLQGGVVNLNGRDYVFKEAQGEFQF